jgi:tungstate transport system ATP-binding protein
VDVPALAATGIRKSYAGRLALQVDEISVQRGESFVLLGPNGSGKSTLLRLLALLEPPDSGRISYFGQGVTSRSLQARRRLAVVLQRPVAFQGKVWRNVALGLKMRRTPRSEVRSRVGDALDLLGISHLAEADAHRLSGGELQRVALARALVLRPEILFLDEPSSALDPSLRARFRQDLLTAAGRLDSTMFLVTHDQAEAIALATRLAIMHEGRLVQQGRPEDVIGRPLNRFVAAFLGAETIWRGRVEQSRGGACTVRTRAGIPVEVVSHCRLGEEVTLAIRAEDVALAIDAAPPSSSVRNRWAGRVEESVFEGPVVRVRVRLAARDEGGMDDHVLASSSGRVWPKDPGGEGASALDFYLTALVTSPSAAELGIVPGKMVAVAVKATAVHVLED